MFDSAMAPDILCSVEGRLQRWAISMFRDKSGNYKTRLGDVDSTLTILKVESLPGRPAIHIRIDNILFTNSEGGLEPQTITRAPITKKALDESVTRLVKKESHVPNFEEEYRDWRNDEGGVFTISVVDVVQVLEDACNLTSESCPNLIGHSISWWWVNLGFFQVAVTEMYGPPSDCKGEVFRGRKSASMYPAFLWRVVSPGHDEIRRVPVLRNASAM